MPTSRLKNTVYRFLLPFSKTDSGTDPVSGVYGHSLTHADAFRQLIRRHHVLGSSTLIESGNLSSVICTSSVYPPHAAQPDSFFRVASITKTATAVLTMHLADLDILSLDAPVSCYLRSVYTGNGLDGITIRRLLSHTSGLVDPAGLESSLEKGVPFTELLHDARQFPPGSSFHYSNLGYGLIGCILEALLERPVSVIFNDYLFNPLHMNATLEGCTLSRDRIVPVTRVLPYHEGNDMILTLLGSKQLSETDPLRHYGHTAGSMYTDTASLQTLYHVLISDENGYLSGDSLSEMKKEHADYGKLSPTLSYGLGLLIIRDPSLSDNRILGHQGFAYGCVDGAFWEESTGRLLITLNGGCSEARTGRLGLSNRDFIRWAFRKELPSW